MQNGPSLWEKIVVNFHNHVHPITKADQKPNDQLFKNGVFGFFGVVIGKGKRPRYDFNYDSLLCLPCVWIMNFHSYFGNSITTVHCGGYNKRLNLWGLDFTFVFYIIAMKTHIPI